MIHLTFTQKFMLKLETQLSVLKSCVDCELSKIDAFSDSVKNILANPSKEKVIMLTLTFFNKTLQPWKTN